MFINTFQKLFLFLKKKLALFALNFHFALNHTERASVMAQTFVSLWPDDLNCLAVAQRVFRNNRDWENFFNVYRQVEKIHPDKLKVSRNFGSALLHSGRYEDAVSKFLSCIENWSLEDSYATAWANTNARLALCYAFLGKFSESHELLNQSQKIIRWDPDMILGFLLVYLGTGRFDEAITFLDDEIKRNPKLHSLYYWRGLFVQYYFHDPVEALVWYLSSLRLVNYSVIKNKYLPYFFSPLAYAAPVEILKRVISICVQQKKPLKALWLTIWTKLRTFDNEINLQVLYAYLLVQMGSLDQAKRMCQRKLERTLPQGEAVLFYELLAIINLKKREFDQCENNAMRALSFDPEMLSAWKILGAVQIEREEWDFAVQTLKKVISMNRFDYRDWARLGGCYKNLNEILSAKTSFEQAVQLNPLAADTWVDLADLYFSLGDTSLALTAYRKGLQFSWLSQSRKEKALLALSQIG